MDRRLVIAMEFVVLALAALAVAGSLSPAGPPAAGGATRLPQPAPCLVTERPQTLSILPGTAVAALRIPNSMSGEFAVTRFASTGSRPAPSIHIPPDSWRFTGRQISASPLPAAS